MKVKLDELDMEILDILEKDSKTRIHLIAKKLNVPSSTIHHRIKKLEKENIIQNWSINKNYKKLGLKLKAHILIHVDVTELKKLKKTQKDIAQKISKFANVQGVDVIVGEADMLTTLRARDMEDLEDILIGKIQRIEGITKTKTILVVSEFNNKN